MRGTGKLSSTTDTPYPIESLMMAACEEIHKLAAYANCSTISQELKGLLFNDFIEK